MTKEEHWAGTIRVRLASDQGIPGMDENMRFYDWKLEFVYADSKKETLVKLKARVAELEAEGKIIGGIGDPIGLHQHITKSSTLTLEALKEVKTE